MVQALPDLSAQPGTPGWRLKALSLWLLPCFLLLSLFPSPLLIPLQEVYIGDTTVWFLYAVIGIFYISCSEVGDDLAMPLAAPVLLSTMAWQ